MSLTPCWIDSHAHLDAAELNTTPDMLQDIRALARERGVDKCVIPAVCVGNFERVRELAYQLDDTYALGIHPLYVPQAEENDLARLESALDRYRHDPRLVAVGEIGLDFFLPSLCEPVMRERQIRFYRAQLALAQRHQLPVLLHVRRSVDFILKYLRQHHLPGGIAHAFNGSEQQAQALIQLGMLLGFGGAVTFEGAHRLRHLATQLPLSALALETDSPDIPPQWLYRTAAQRQQGAEQGINTPAELPRIAETVATLRGIHINELALETTQNVLRTLGRLDIGSR
ncbi:MAG: putative deoxyribonuclease YjjV [Pseudomonadota bacterium]